MSIVISSSVLCSSRSRQSAVRTASMLLLLLLASAFSGDGSLSVIIHFDFDNKIQYVAAISVNSRLMFKSNSVNKLLYIRYIIASRSVI